MKKNERVLVRRLIDGKEISMSSIGFYGLPMDRDRNGKLKEPQSRKGFMLLEGGDGLPEVNIPIFSASMSSSDIEKKIAELQAAKEKRKEAEEKAEAEAERKETEENITGETTETVMNGMSKNAIIDRVPPELITTEFNKLKTKTKAVLIEYLKNKISIEQLKA